MKSNQSNSRLIENRTFVRTQQDIGDRQAGQADRWTDKHGDRETDRQGGRQAGWQTGR